MNKLWLFVISVVFLAFSLSANGEEKGDSVNVMKAVIEEGDTIYLYNMQEYEFEHDRSISTRIKSRRFTRLMRDIEKTMPYARLAAEKIEEIDSIMMTLESDRERESFLDSAEDRLMDDFEEDLKSLNRRQGLILIKLIDRETGDTTYNLIREYRSRWSAWFWQGMARLFRMNLREEYDPEEEEDIEDAIRILGLDEEKSEEQSRN